MRDDIETLYMYGIQSDGLCLECWLSQGQISIKI